MKRLLLITALLLLIALPAAAQDDDSDGLTFRQLIDALMGSESEAADDEAETEEFASLLKELPQSRTEDGAFVLGDPDAPVTIVEFADFACPHCQTYHPVIEQLITEYVATGQAAFEFRIFPTAGGTLSALTANVVACLEADNPGAFWTLYPELYEQAIAGTYSTEMLQEFAVRYDVSESALVECAETSQRYVNDVEFGESIGVSGTPAVAVRYDGGDAEFITLEGMTYNRGGVPFEVLAEVIESAQE